MKQDKKKKKNKDIVLVKKSNNLVESRYKFDIWETRFFLSILSQIRREDNEFKKYRIWYKDVIKTFGLKSGDAYGSLREAARSLMQKPVYTNYEENGVKRTDELHIIRKLNYLSEKQESSANLDNQEYIDVVIEDEMRPFLLQLQRNFTAYDLRNVVKLGVYSVRLYELLKQYESIGSRTMRIEEMKAMFQVEDQYKLYADFYRWVIAPAEKEINLHTDILILSTEKVKEGKRVVALRFKFRAKTDEELNKARSNPLQGTLFDGLQELEIEEVEQEEEKPTIAEQTEKDKLFVEFQAVVVGEFGVSPTIFLAELENYTQDQVSKAVRVTREAKKAGKVKNLSGFFIDALRKGFTNTKEELAVKKAKEEEQKAKNAIIQEEIENLKDELAALMNEKIRAITASDPNTTADAIEAMRANPAIKVYMDNKERSLGRLLELEDFRTDKKLREWVKKKIIDAHPEDFQDIFASYETKINVLSEMLK